MTSVTTLSSAVRDSSPAPAPGITRIPPDVDAIAARAGAAPGGHWEASADSLWIPWFASTDDEPGGMWCSGRWLAVQEGGWHTGSDDPPPALWEFLAAARDDVLSLVEEVRRLRAGRAAAGKDAA